MDDQLIQSLPLLATGALAPVLIVLTLPRRYAPGAKPFIVLEIGVAVWALAYAFSFLDNELTDKVFWNKVSYSGFAILPGAWLALTLQYSGKDRWLSPRYIGLLAVDPVVRITLAWTNDAHGLVWGPAQLDTTGAVEVLSQTYGPVFLMGLVYSYALLIIGVWVYIREFLHSQRIYLGQAISVLTAVLLPGVVLMAFQLGLRPLSYDPTAFAAVVSAFMLLWGFFGTRFFDVVPVARDLIIEDMGEGVIVLDPHDLVIGLNRSAGLMIGEAPGNVIGHQATEALAVVAPPLATALSGQDIPSEIRLDITGREQWYELRVLPIPIRGARGLGRLIMMHDTTQRRQAEEGLRLRNQELETLLKIADALAGPGSFVQKCTGVLDELSGLVEADWMTLRQAGGDEQSLYLVAKAGPATIEYPPMLALTDRETLAATAFQLGETIVVNDYAGHPKASPAFVALGMRSMVLMPLQAHGRRLGLINAVSSYKDHFTPARVRLFTAIGEGIGVLFENTRLSQELQAHMEELAVVDEISRILSSTLDIDQAYDQFATEVNKLVPFDRASIQVINHDSDTYTVRHLHGQVSTGTRSGDVVALAGSHTEHTIASGRSEITGDVAVDPRFLTDPGLIEAGLHSTLVVPLASKGRVIGSMALSSRRVNAYGPREQAILERMASQITSAIENSILFAATVRLGVAVAAVGESICITDLDGGIEFINQALQELLGYDAAELIGMPVSKLYPGGADNPVFQTIMEALSIGPWSGEVELLAKNGNLVSTLEVATPMRERAGQVVGYVCVNTDLRERKKTEEERRTVEVKALAQSKLATLGQVATGVAHEINQPLTYINTFIQALQEDLELQDLDPERMKPRLAEALRQVSRIDIIVQHLRTFGRQRDAQKSLVSLEWVVDNTLLLLGGHLRATNIDVKRSIDPSLPPVMGNANQLEEVLINLFQNSVDAFREDQADAQICVTVTQMLDEEALRVQFSDNGVGIAPAHLARIFEPFFTTKEEGQGTGLGLSIIYGIITDHRGSIICESEYTKGTTITIMLPVGEAPHAKT